MLSYTPGRSGTGPWPRQPACSSPGAGWCSRTSCSSKRPTPRTYRICTTGATWRTCPPPRSTSSGARSTGSSSWSSSTWPRTSLRTSEVSGTCWSRGAATWKAWRTILSITWSRESRLGYRRLSATLSAGAT
ncbi:unnamed protein product [Ectocarpus sp. 13 AM-2016]